MKLPRLLSPLLALALTLAATSAFAANPAFDTWVDTFTTDWVRTSPESATSSQYFSGTEQDTLDRLLTPITPEYEAARVAAAKKGLAELARVDRSTLDASQKISADLVHWSLDNVVQGDAFRDFSFVFDQMGGLHVGLVNFLSQTHPIRNARDIDNYLARLALVAARMDEGIARAKDAATRGFIMPKFIYAAALGQFDRFLDGAPRQNILVTSLDERAAKLSEISSADRAKSSPPPKRSSPIPSSPPTAAPKPCCRRSNRSPPTMPASGAFPTAMKPTHFSSDA